MLVSLAVIEAVAQRGLAGADIGGGDAARRILVVDAALLASVARHAAASDVGRWHAPAAPDDAALAVRAAVTVVAAKRGAVEIGLARKCQAREHDKSHVHTITPANAPTRHVMSA